MAYVQLTFDNHQNFPFQESPKFNKTYDMGPILFLFLLKGNAC